MKPHPLAALVAVLVFVSPLAAQKKVEVTNNQPFPIAMPLTLLGEGAPTVMVDVEANRKQTIEVGAKPQSGAAKVSVEPVDNGVRLKSGDRDLGTLSWDLLFEKLAKAIGDDDVDKTKRDFAKEF